MQAVKHPSSEARQGAPVFSLLTRRPGCNQPPVLLMGCHFPLRLLCAHSRDGACPCRHAASQASLREPGSPPLPPARRTTRAGDSLPSRHGPADVRRRDPPCGSAQGNWTKSLLYTPAPTRTSHEMQIQERGEKAHPGSGAKQGPQANFMREPPGE